MMTPQWSDEYRVRLALGCQNWGSELSYENVCAKQQPCPIAQPAPSQQIEETFSNPRAMFTSEERACNKEPARRNGHVELTMSSASDAIGNHELRYGLNAAILNNSIIQSAYFTAVLFRRPLPETLTVPEIDC